MWKNGKTAGRLAADVPDKMQPGLQMFPLPGNYYCLAFRCLGRLRSRRARRSRRLRSRFTVQTCSDSLRVEHAGTWHQARQIGGASRPCMCWVLKRLPMRRCGLTRLARIVAVTKSAELVLPPSSSYSLRYDYMPIRSPVQK